MHNDSEKISANEINRYVYCNYQWYYNRVYGSKKLTFLKKELNKSLGVKSDPRNHAFVRGNKFHKKYHIKYKFKKALIIIAVLLVLVAIVFILKDGTINVGDLF